MTIDEPRIKTRAYFLFENRTGRDWQHSISNWLEAEREERFLSFCGELSRRVEFIRDLYATYRIPLKPDQGLTRALAEAEALGAGDKASFPYSRDYLIQLTNDAHVIYGFGGDLETAVNAGLDVSHHLSNLTTGTTDYGVPSSRNNAIFFKDFEFELFLVSSFLRKGLNPIFTTPGDPCGELVCLELRIEAKHPNSVGQLTKQLGKFQRSLSNSNAFGVFAVALEDAMTLGDVSEFHSREEYDDWLAVKRNGMEALGQRLIAMAARLPRVVALVQTQTKVEIVGGTTTLRRLGNAMLFDHRTIYPNYADAALAIASVFNPVPLRFSEMR